MHQLVATTLALAVLAPVLLAEDTELPSFEECRGSFYAVTRYEHFSWAGHYRRIEGTTAALDEGERLAFQATLDDFSDAHFEKVISIHELRHLSLVDTGITDEGLKHAEQSTGLLSVNISSNDAVTNKGAAPFKNNSGLYSASFGGSRKLDDEWMSVLQHWPELTEIRIDATPVTGVGFSYFQHTPKLKIVEGWNTFQISDTAIEHLARVKTLRHLNLWECRDTTSAGLQKLKSCTELEELILVEVSGVDDAFAGSLTSLKSLRLLQLSFSDNLTDKGVASLAKLPSLKQLDLDDCKQLTDTAAEHITGISTLCILSLADCDDLTNEAVKHISKLTSLTKLNLSNCPGITSECLDDILKLKNLEVLIPPSSFIESDLEAIRKAFPNIKIEWF